MRMPWPDALREGLHRVARPDPTGAIPFLLRAAETDAPHNEQADAHVALGRIRTGLGQHVLAAEHYRAVLALRPAQAEARFLLGRALARMGWPDLALAQFALLPQPLGGWWRNGAQQAARQVKKARDAFAAFRASEDAAVESAIRALIQAGRISPAVRALAALTPTPERRWLAAALRLRLRQGVADPALRRALMPPEDATPALRLEAAQYLLSLGEVEAAMAALDDAVQGRAAHAFRARLLLATGDLDALDAMAAAEMVRVRHRTDPARHRMTCQVLRGDMPVWHGPGPVVGAPPNIPLVQFWHDSSPPEDVRAVLESWVRHHPHLPLARFDTATARAFIAAQHGAMAAKAFDACHNAALRSNMLRLVFLAVHGGLWVDADERCLRPMDEVLARLPEHGLIATFSDELPFYLHNYMLAALPGSDVMEALIEAQMPPLLAFAKGRGTVENWETNGPGLVTRVAARMPGSVALLAPTYWRSFAADADDLAYKRDTESDWRLNPRG